MVRILAQYEGGKPKPPEKPGTKCHPAANSPRSVRYNNGEIQMSVADLWSNGFGLPWGHTRVYNNQLDNDGLTSHDYGNGTNWIVREWAYLVDAQGDDSEIVVVISSNESFWFDEDQGSYTGRHNARHTLEHDTENNVFKFIQTCGTIWEFADFDPPVQQQMLTNEPEGGLKSVTTPGGQTLTLSYNASQQVSEATRSSGSGATSKHESYVYTYIDDAEDPNDGNLEHVLVRRKTGTDAWASSHEVRRVRYTYYGTSDDNGNQGDLKQAILQLPDGMGGWTDHETTYYRYYKDSAGGVGFQHGLRYVLGPEAYSRAPSPLSASNATLDDYADYKFEYDGSQRVTEEVCDGGQHTYTFDYTPNTASDGYNNWKRKTIATLPDSNQNIVYTNYIGQVLVNEFKSGSDSWVTYYVYDDDGRLIQTAMPSAVTSYVDNAGGGSDELSVTLESSAGLIQVTDYYTSTSGTISETVAGGVKGRVQYDKIKNGSSGSEIKVRERKYFERTAGGATVYPIAEDIQYRSDASGGSDPVTTAYSYTWHSGTTQYDQKTTKMPAVSAAQNGENVVDEQIDVFDTQGHHTWNKGARGYIRYQEYDAGTGAVTKTIEDVDTTQTGDFDNLPAGWSTPADGGRHLISDFEQDDLGRTTQELGPAHSVDISSTATEVRRASWTVYDDADHEVRTAQGYQETSDSSFTLVNPVSITVTDSAGRTIEQISATRASTSGKLDEGDTFAQTSYVRWTTQAYNDNGQLTSMKVYHDIPDSGNGTAGADNNYNETTFGYDGMNRQNMRKTPGGTITRTVFDERGFAASTWVGTDDSGATDDDPTGSAHQDNNMVVVTENAYDGGNDGGDGNLTSETQHVDGSTTRVTTHTYDWRNRRETTDGEEDFYEKVYYDNLSRVTKTERYDTNGAGDLVSRSETKYDDRGRVYQTIRHEVDPSDGTVGDHLTDNFWYDCCGNQIKSHPGGSEAFTKTLYDSLGRAVKTFTGYDASESTYAEAQSVSGDTIFEEAATCGAPLVTYEDDFNRADLSDLGSDWSEVSGDWEISSNKLVLDTETSGSTALWNEAPSSRDYDVEAVVSSTQTNAVAQVVARYEDSQNFYAAQIKFGTTTGSLKIMKYQGGDSFAIASGNLAISTSTDYTLKLSVEGQTFRLYLDGELMLTAFESGLTERGQAGVRMGTGGGTDATKWDDFKIYEAPSGFDDAGNQIITTTLHRYHDDTNEGQLVAGVTARPSYTAVWHDAIGRVIATAEYGTSGGTAFERPATIPARSDTVLVTTTEYNDDGEPYKTIDPAGKEMQTVFDDAGRVTKTIDNYTDGDPETGGSDADVTVEQTYNADGQVATLTAKQSSSSDDQTTTYVYGTDTGGITPEIYRSDLLRAVIYPDSDDPSSLLANGDDSTYDRVEYKYNRQGQIVELKDQNGSVHEYDYDDLGRRTQDRITTVGGSVDNAVLRIATTYEVRGMVASVTSYDNATIGNGSVVNEIVREYNDLGMLTKEYQEHEGAKDGSTLYVENSYDETASSSELTKGMRLTKVTYPNGRFVHYTYGAGGSDADYLNRLDAIKDDSSGSPGSTLSSFSYLGREQIMIEDYEEPDVRLDLFGGTSGTYAGLDRFGRVIDQKWYDYGASADRDRFQYGYDRVGNRDYRDHTVASAKDEFYTYDGVNRLATMDRGNLTGSPPTGISGTPAREQDWTLDPLGNWAALVEKTSGSTDLSQTRTHRKVNEISDIAETTGTSWATPAYDGNGNTTTMPKPSSLANTYTCTYDAWNRLVTVTDSATLVGRYEYDGLNRRVKKHLDSQSPSSPDGVDTYEHYFYNEAWQVLETRDTTTESDQPESLDVRRQSIWSPRYIDAPILQDRDADDNSGTGDLGKSSSGLEQRVYYLSDANMNVTSLVDTAGDALERYVYDPYGHLTIYDATWSSTRSTSSYANPHTFTGQQLDVETGLYYYRARYYSAQLGRFASRDPVEYAQGANLYCYCNNNAQALTDPLGLACVVCAKAKAVYKGDIKPLDDIVKKNSVGRGPYQFLANALVSLTNLNLRAAGYQHKYYSTLGGKPITHPRKKAKDARYLFVVHWPICQDDPDDCEIWVDESKSTNLYNGKPDPKVKPGMPLTDMTNEHHHVEIIDRKKKVDVCDEQLIFVDFPGRQTTRKDPPANGWNSFQWVVNQNLQVRESGKTKPVDELTHEITVEIDNKGAAHFKPK